MSSDIMVEFVVDAREHLQAADGHLIALEKDPAEPDEINGLLRRIHTIKGNAGFLNLNRLYELLHRAENVMQAVRERQGAERPKGLIDVFFQVLDTVGIMVTRIEEGRSDEVGWYDGLLGSLETIDQALNNPPDVQIPSRPIDGTTRGRIELPAGHLKAGEEPGLTVIELSEGDLDIQSQGLITRIHELIRRGTRSFVFDIRRLQTLKNGQIDVLIAAAKPIEDPGRAGLLLNDDEQHGLIRVLKLMAVDRIFRLFTSEAQARSALES